MKMKSNFWDLIANKYEKTPVANLEAYRKKLEITKDYYNQDSRILEFGCGTGSTAIYHAPNVKEILATDISANMIQIASNKVAQSNIENIELKQSSIEDLELEDSSYDMIMAHSILHLVEDKNYVLQKIYRALKPNGTLISSTACVNEITPLFKFISPIMAAIPFLPTVKCFDSKNLIESFSSAKFNIEYQWQESKKDALFLIAKK